MNRTYAIGIDLGTTNSVVAYTRLDRDEASVELLPIPQITAPATIEERFTLPSFLYLGTPEEQQGGTFNMPWADQRDYAVGAFARHQAADVPQRTVAAAKSWLCHNRVNRHDPILPWNVPNDLPRISPVAASQRYLEHLAATWNRAFPDCPIQEQLVTLTVPASFDASARELTREAAHAAGLPNDLILMEEPQSALYAWLSHSGEQWRKHLSVDDTLLVCDIGGGTTDFTLISVAEEDGELQLTRRAVGNHILVGGDNMDLALAHTVQQALAGQGQEINAWQSVSLWHACRLAKESLLSQEAPESAPVTILGRGSSVIGGSLTTELRADQVQDILVNGFFPLCNLGDRPAKQPASGFRQIGLPFESDAAITRHLSGFLSQHGEGEPVRPTHIVFNGGVLKAPALQQRLSDAMAHWYGADQAPAILDTTADLDYAVARGAAYYGHSKHHGGVRIRGGTARAYYIGIETSGLAVPGAERPLQALCVVPHGMEEGTSLTVPGSETGLVVGEPAQFRFFSSASRKADQPGQLLTAWTPDEMVETDPLEMTLPAEADNPDGYVPVRLESHITELGVFELWCVSTQSDDRWKLEFSVRSDAE
jgi:molecular chaperone DnaK (HSP70)